MHLKLVSTESLLFSYQNWPPSSSSRSSQRQAFDPDLEPRDEAVLCSCQICPDKCSCSAPSPLRSDTFVCRCLQFLFWNSLASTISRLLGSWAPGCFWENDCFWKKTTCNFIECRLTRSYSCGGVKTPWYFLKNYLMISTDALQHFTKKQNHRHI